MSVEKAKEYLLSRNWTEPVLEFEASSATVALAAQVIGCKEAEIAKTLSFLVGDQPILVVCAGDAKINNPAFKHTFGKKAKMIQADQLEELIGHPAGGVCPFGVKENVKIYLDESLRRFEKVYPAAGSVNSAICCSIEQLEDLLPQAQWVDVCKGWREEEGQ